MFRCKDVFLKFFLEREWLFTGNPVHVIFLREVIITQPAVLVTACKNLLSSMLLFYSLEPRLRSRWI